jgi:hypothetical protein
LYRFAFDSITIATGNNTGCESLPYFEHAPTPV